MTIEQFESKFEKWFEKNKIYIYKGMQSILNDIKNDVFTEMTNKKLNVVTGKTRDSGVINQNIDKMDYSFDIDKKRKFIARLQESGYNTRGGRTWKKSINLFSSIREKYRKIIAIKILKEFMFGYKNG